MRLLPVLSASFLLPLLAAQPSLVRLPAVADASANADMPAVNNGGATLVTCGKDFTTAGTFRVWMTRGHFLFDLTPLAGRPLPGRVRLRLWQAQSNAAGCLDVTAHRVTQAWSETAVTWQNKPGHDPAVAARQCVGDSFDGGWKSFDVTALAHEWLNNVSPNHGIVVRDPTEQTAGAARPLDAASREAANAGERPQLEVAWDTLPFGTGCGTRVPVPSLDIRSGEPMLGSAYELRVHDFTAGAGLVHIVGASDTAWNGIALPLNLGFFGYPLCSLYVSADVLVSGTADSRGRAQITFPVPNVPFLRNRKIHHQTAGIDASLALSFTNGFTTRIY